MATATKASRRKQVSFRDRLSRLTFHQACQLLGDDGPMLLRQGGREWELDPDEDAYLGDDLYRVRIKDGRLPAGKAIVLLTQISGKKQALHLQCDQCETPCAHAGAALGLLLEEKLIFGLSAPPDESVPLELLTEEELIARALAERQQRAAEEKMTLRSTDSTVPWTDYVVTSHSSGKSYRVSLRGDGTNHSYCSCPDFRTNHLGTCKHILHALDKVANRFPKKALAQPYRHTRIELWADYRDPAGLRFNLPDNVDDAIRKLAGPFVEQRLTDPAEAVKLLRRLEKAGHDVLVYPDAEEWIERGLTRAKLAEATAEIRRDPGAHPLRRELLKAELLPYQLDGVAFAVGAGRAVLADDMGLGKTIQGIGVAELLARLVGIERVLVVCPASLKSQWRDEIRRFCDRDAQLVAGAARERAAQYADGTFFTICNYEQVLRDLDQIERVEWDLIVLDEGQRIKNWQSKTSQIIRSLDSRFALVLSGTPLENRLDDLFTVVRFVDERQLGPAYRFFHRHRVVNDTGRVQGYRNLDELRELLRPILLRRTRAEVAKQLPERTTTTIRIRPTAEQLDIHDGQMQVVAQITSKRFLTEMDLLRLQKALMMCRMAADSTYLIEKELPGYSSKLEHLKELLEGLAAEQGRKIILFSEWRRMLDLIEPVLDKLGVQYVRLDGQVPQKQRPILVRRFQEDADCRAILMTNAGSTGLNLQAANTVINVDLPWNPAVLEQRVARAHRMGQKNPVDVYLLVTEDTIEEKLLGTLAQKHDLALAALDAASDVSEVAFQSGMEELRRRVEQLVGAKPAAPLDVSRLDKVESETRAIAERRDRVAAAGGQLLGAAFQLVGELVASQDRPAADPETVNRLRSGLTESIERDATGRPQLRVTLPDDGALEQFAEALAKLLVAK
ncbi:MAG: DEAD/DEAH box helicase [Planctomycetales bacterium]